MSVHPNRVGGYDVRWRDATGKMRSKSFRRKRDAERYDLSAVGRVKMNSRLNQQTADNLRLLRKDDILSIVKVLVELKDGRGEIDDIDHLGNRRVRSVGELLENQYRIGLLRMERAIRERMSSVEIDTVMPHDLINAKPAAAAVRASTVALSAN